MTCEPPPARRKEAHGRYIRDMAVAAALYVGFVFVAALIIRNLHPPQWALVVLAVLPTAPALLMLRAYVVYLASMDEFQRRMQTDAIVISTGIVVFGSFTYGFLESWANLPHIEMLWVFPIFCMIFGVTHIVIRLRNK
ncbi:hypothetical protein [Terricaulis sp.]|uniref:hypothetical protein n=1 Tax=Terricaulis sp. TaxID=2768686 RepID=UPI003783EE7E